jgi:hypothetical protein
MRGESRSPGAIAAAEHLRGLLEQMYREEWSGAGGYLRGRVGRVHVKAVAEVLARWLRDHPRDGKPSDRDIEGQTVTPTVSRVLNAQMLSRATLELFINAFWMSDEDAITLRELHSGIPQAHLTIFPPPTPLPVGQREHQTLTLHEFHRVGPDGIPQWHETLQSIRSLIDELEVYPYRFDTNEIKAVRVRSGGSASPIYHVHDQIWAVNISLEKPLALGEEASLRYLVRFDYRTPPPPEFRRALSAGIASVELHVTFSKGRLPRRVWRTTWSDWTPGSHVLEEEQVELKGREAYWRKPDREPAVVGFRWEF